MAVFLVAEDDRDFRELLTDVFKDGGHQVDKAVDGREALEMVSARKYDVVLTDLRCDDCIKYHLENCFKEGATKEEVMETLSIATLVGGTIVVPHLRRAYEFWEELESQNHN